MKVLNLYAGIGGNRYKWPKSWKVTAVELDENIAKVYSDRFPKDKVIVGDAHQYLVDHYQEFDFIWSSPPCPTHSSFRQNICVRFRGTKAVYPDMKLYQEVIFLTHNFAGKWVVENVKPYYKYLIGPDTVLQRHPFWSNFEIPNKEFISDKIRTAQIPDLQKLHDIDLSGYKLKEKRKILRNCVHYPLGKYIAECLNKSLYIK